jgi:hypothetical protein
MEEIWDTEAAESYDTPGVGMFAPEVLTPMAARLAELAGHGRALEFAIGNRPRRNPPNAARNSCERS